MPNSTLLVWFGAGEANTPQLDFSAYAKVTLIEAREEACSVLSERFGHADNVEVLGKPIGQNAGEASFHIASLPEFSSASKFYQLTHLYPGMTITDTSKTEFVDVDEVCESLDAGFKNITVVCDLLDINGLLVEALTKCAAWPYINQMYIPLPELTLYANASSSNELMSKLGEQGFEVTNTDQTDPDIPIVYLCRNHLWSELNESKRENVKLNEMLQQKVEQYEGALNEIKQAALEAHTEYNQALKKAEEENLQAQTELKESHTTLNSELTKLNSENKELSEANKTLVAEQDDLKIKLSKVEHSFVEMEQQLKEEINLHVIEQEELETELTKVKNALRDLGIEKSQLNEQNDRLSGQLETLTEKVQQTETERLAKQKKWTQESQQRLAANQQLVEANEELEQKYTSIVNDYEELTAKIDNVCSQLEETQGAHVQQIQDAAQKIEVLDEAVSLLKSEKADLEHERDKLIVEGDDAKQKYQDELGDLTSQLAELNSQLVETTKQRDGQTNSYQQCNKKVEGLQHELSKLQEALSVQYKTHDLALMLQTKAQVDLEHLRNEYHSMYQREKQLVELVGNLKSSLLHAKSISQNIELEMPKKLGLSPANSSLPPAKQTKSKK